MTVIVVDPKLLPRGVINKNLDAFVPWIVISATPSTKPQTHTLTHSPTHRELLELIMNCSVSKSMRGVTCPTINGTITCIDAFPSVSGSASIVGPGGIQ